jgi:ribosome biogenesis protein SSF1/2
MEIWLRITEDVPGRGMVICHEFGTWWFGRHQRPRFVGLFLSVKKTKLEIVAQRASHAAKERLRKECWEGQERNMQHRKVLAEKSRVDAPGATGEAGEVAATMAVLQRC